MSHLRVCVSPSAADRLARARACLAETRPGDPILIIGASRGAADDLARHAAAGKPASFGVERLSLVQLAARTAIVAMAANRLSPSTILGAEAVAARAVFDATRDGALRYFSPVAATPGFPRALAQTLQELRLAGLTSRDVARLPRAGRDLAELLERFETAFHATSAADRAALLDTATRLVQRTPVAGVVVLLDLPLAQRAERRLVEALIAGAASTFATVPHGDADTLAWFESVGGRVERPASEACNDLGYLRQFLFDSDATPPERALDGSLQFFSAPGEGRESVEITRRILQEARRGVRFDEMAVLVRSPPSYVGLLEHAFRRAGIPAWFDRGVRRPHPAGRAFLALLASAAERLSASRFSEYLSLGQVPQPGDRDTMAWAAPQDEALARSAAPRDQQDDTTAGGGDEYSESVVAGTLRAPWKWEKLLVESAVIGQNANRWRRRLDGKARELQRQAGEAARRDGGDEAKVRGLERTIEELKHLRAFALPIIERMAAWPAVALWREWLDLFEQIAPRVLRAPAHVLRVLAELRPMGDVGPVDLDEVRRVLSDRLLTVAVEPPSRRFGRVFVGTPQQARGRSFRVVFVPGLAERMFPQKPREDPLLLDELRAASSGSLPVQRQRLAHERLLLQLATGAADDRLYVSYPRIELSESRARVPSFYALDVMRAATGSVPDHEALEERAREAGNATLAWPAPSLPGDAIDDQEHDLAVLRSLIDEPSPERVKGHAHYLLKLNDCLRRSVVERWARGGRRWSSSDGLTKVTPQTKEAFDRLRLTSRSYSLSALQRFSACPYQFLLAAVYRLQPLAQPEPLQRMDPLTRGSLFHEIQARFFTVLQAHGELPVVAANIEPSRRRLDVAIDDVTRRGHDEFAPAVERVWDDEVASIRRDLHAWLECVAVDGNEWQPKYFEFGFGPVPGERDEHSVSAEAIVGRGFRLRGAIDLIEEHRQTKVLRVTDHKTGRKPDRIEKVTIGGGAVLQPVLYAMAVEAVLAQPVHHGRLFYCTSAGSFFSHPIPLNERTRALGLDVLETVDRALETGFVVAAPTEDACGRCDFRTVCGPDVFQRVARKPRDPLADLLALRGRP